MKSRCYVFILKTANLAMKNNDIIALELSANTKPHIVNGNIQRLVYELKKSIQKNDIVVIVRTKK